MTDEERLKACWAETLRDQDWATIDPAMSLRPAATLSGAPTSAEASEAAATSSGAIDETLSGYSTLTGAGEADLGERTTSTSIAEYVADSLQPRTGGNYELIEEIARGGMGVVYRARQSCLEREVAVKRVLDRQGQSAARLSFVSESLVTGLLDHPNIVPVHELSCNEDGDVFLAMKLVGGQPWSSLLRADRGPEGGITDDEALRRHLDIFDAVCNAIAFAHSKGIIHRDLKPDNVMVGEYGEVLVMDWGIAIDVRSADESDGRAPHKSIVRAPAGTPQYMAPEMADGRGEDLSPATDIYLLGGLLHVIISGRPPHAGRTLMQVLLEASRSQVPAFAADVPQDLADICRKALARDAGRRHADVRELQEDVRAFLTHRESERIVDAAKERLDACRGQPADSAVARAELYARFAEAVAGFQQARTLWADNPRALGGERTARYAYAQVAFQAGDLMLAEAQVRAIGVGRKAKALYEEVTAAREEQERNERQRRVLRRGLMTAAIVLVVVLAAGYLLVSSARSRAESALRRESAALAETRKALKREAEQRTRADASAVEAQRQAELARDEAWRGRIGHAELMFAQAVACIEQQQYTEASAYLLKSYELAPAHMRPAAFTPGRDEPPWASFAWTALGLQQLHASPPACIALEEGERARSLRFDKAGRLLVATDRRLVAYDVDERRILASLSLPCRDMTLIEDGRLMVVTCEDRPPQVVATRDLRIQHGLDDGVDRDCYWLRSDPGASFVLVYDRMSGSVLQWRHDARSPMRSLSGNEPGTYLQDMRIGAGSFSFGGTSGSHQRHPPSDARGEQTFAVRESDGTQESGWSLCSDNGRWQAWATGEAGRIGCTRTAPPSRMRTNMPWDDAGDFTGLGGIDREGRMLMVAKRSALYVDLSADFTLLQRRSLPYGDRMRSFAFRSSDGLSAYSLADESGLRHIQLFRPRPSLNASFRNCSRIVAGGGLRLMMDAQVVPEGMHGVGDLRGGRIGELSGFLPGVQAGRMACVYSPGGLKPYRLVVAGEQALTGARQERALFDQSLPEHFVPQQWSCHSGDRFAVLGRNCEDLILWAGVTGKALMLNDCSEELHTSRGGVADADERLFLLEPAAQRCIDLPGSTPAHRPLGRAPWPQSLSWDARRPWILAHRGSRLVAIDAADGGVLTLADAGDDLAAVAIDELGRQAFVVAAGSDHGRVVAIDVRALDGLRNRSLRQDGGIDDDDLSRAAVGGVVSARCRIDEGEADLVFARFSMDGSRLLVVSRQGYCALYDCLDGRRLWKRIGFMPITGCFHPHRDLFAAWGLEDSYTVDLLELSTGRSIARLYPLQWSGLEAQVPSMRFADDGARLVIAHSRQLYTYDLFASGSGEEEPDAAGFERVLSQLRRSQGCLVDDDGRIEWVAEEMR